MGNDHVELAGVRRMIACRPAAIDCVHPPPDVGPAPEERHRMSETVSVREEVVNALTHGFGAAAALAGGAVLITLAALYGDGWQLVSAIVFGLCLLLLYIASTLYHAIQHPVAKAR